MKNSCFYCGKKETSRNLLYNLDKDGHKICQSCMREGYTKSALEIIEHNKMVDEKRKSKPIQFMVICKNENQAKLFDYIVRIGTLNCEIKYIEEVLGIEWNKKFDINYKIKDATSATPFPATK